MRTKLNNEHKEQNIFVNAYTYILYSFYVEEPSFIYRLINYFHGCILFIQCFELDTQKYAEEIS